ncbi:hypothetical protein G432_06530 [Sphingomonas sp. MM-1]|uniref:hypothetical protein n=1 Tax=Sphingomonas sp. MM-1 TaxID=745310 RepID=UPI0002C0E5E1|nr:hypothetical protein [Sphingomonas sp. MM-1]AGH49031.1 hypothetical protein G432_06530 [Sphingomonas sp. MM-1]
MLRCVPTRYRPADALIVLSAFVTGAPSAQAALLLMEGPMAHRSAADPAPMHIPAPLPAPDAATGANGRDPALTPAAARQRWLAAMAAAPDEDGRIVAAGTTSSLGSAGWLPLVGALMLVAFRRPRRDGRLRYISAV